VLRSEIGGNNKAMDGNTFYFQWEALLIETLQSRMGDAAVAVASFFTLFGEEVIMIAVLGFLYWVYDKQFARFVGTNIMVGLIVNPMIKNVVFRRRPYFDIAGVSCLKPVDGSAGIYDIAAQGYSFPSGHTLNATILYGSLPKYKRNRVLIVLGIVLPLLVGASRVMLGVHFPTDVLAGWIFGTVILFLVSYLQTHIKRQNLFHLILFLIACVGAIYCRTEDYYTGLGIMAGFFLSIPFEERFVKFAPTRKILPAVLRIAGGFVLYFVLNMLLKLPFSDAFLDAATMPAFLVRSVRYAVILFVLLGVYPILFGRIRKIVLKCLVYRELI